MSKLASALFLTTAMISASPTYASGDVIRIGVLNDQTGLYAEFGGLGSVEAAKLAVEEFGGRVLGKKIEIVAADHQNKTDIGLSTARKWFDADNVDMITDLTNSAIAIGVQNLAKERGKITIAVGPGTTRLTNEDCSPTGFHWMWDTYSQAAGTARAVLENGGKKWFILAADYAFGHQMAADLSRAVQDHGGIVTGNVRHPLGTSDFSSFLLQAQASKAEIVGLANAGADTINSIKQAAEFNLAGSGQKLVGLVVVISDIRALGLSSSKGLLVTTAYYWDRDESSREFASKYQARTGKKPGMIQAGVYSGVLHYLKSMQVAGTEDGKAVAAQMHKLPVQDAVSKNALVRQDGRVIRNMYLVEVKSPSESTGDWDYYRIVRTIPGDQTAIPLSESKCALLKQ
ncbi:MULTISPECIES: ABC transporter substrate-binding protein [unclassified Bradyrhizobium]|uniref:ABC transporter substrate-binding protein n=1 Tax=unclassified Bradyrhizobium TaxID=2631580 RepID=UPI000420F3A4|nr:MULTISPECIES: ABC transporter substrate-binding protein [unclassified Bradyrhizobium]MCP3467278.1 ABC transporter substrate-binding protein [Bradyrhizobium sp. CCGUVB23]